MPTVEYKHTINLHDVLEKVLENHEEALCAIQVSGEDCQVTLLAEVNRSEILDMIDSLDVDQHSDILAKLSPCLFKGGALGLLNECNDAILTYVTDFTQSLEAFHLAEDAATQHYVESDEQRADALEA